MLKKLDYKEVKLLQKCADIDVIVATLFYLLGMQSTGEQLRGTQTGSVQPLRQECCLKHSVFCRGWQRLPEPTIDEADEI